jgi:hypothetical protein
MGFNRRKLEDQRGEAADKEAANRRATDAQVLEDATTNRRLKRAAGRLISPRAERRTPRFRIHNRSFGTTTCAARSGH